MRWNGARKAVQVIKQQDNNETIRESWNNKDRVEWKSIAKGNLVSSGSGTPKYSTQHSFWKVQKGSNQKCSRSLRKVNEGYGT